MATHFQASLNRLLSLRQSLERQEEMRLAVIASHLEAARRDLEGVEAERRQFSTAQITARAEASGAELQAAALRQNLLAEAEQQLQLQIAEITAAHQAQCQRLAERRQARKILETLRDHHAAAAGLESRRRDQARLDEQFLMRR